MNVKRLVFRIHALQRMFQRGISVKDVRQAIKEGKAIEEYPDDHPFPSRLILGWRESQPIHVVVAEGEEGKEMIVVTVYEPVPSRWEPGFERRRKT